MLYFMKFLCFNTNSSNLNPEVSNFENEKHQGILNNFVFPLKNKVVKEDEFMDLIILINMIDFFTRI